MGLRSLSSYSFPTLLFEGPTSIELKAYTWAAYWHTHYTSANTMKIPVVREAFIKKRRIQIGFASFDFNFDLFLNFFLF